MTDIVLRFQVTGVRRCPNPTCGGVLLDLKKLGGTSDDPEERSTKVPELKRSPIKPENIGEHIVQQVESAFRSMGAEVQGVSMLPGGPVLHASNRRRHRKEIIVWELTKEQYELIGPLTNDNEIGFTLSKIELIQVPVD